MRDARRRFLQNFSALPQDDSSWINAMTDDENLDNDHVPQPKAD